MGAVIALPGLAGRRLRVAAAHAAAVAEAAQARPAAHRYEAGSFWLDRRHGGVVVAHGVTLGIGGRACWVTVSRPGAPPGQEAIRLPSELGSLTPHEVTS